MTQDEVIRFYAELEFEKDVRSRPDNLRRGRFKAGWKDFTVRKQEFSEATLKRLTWHNTGYRFGKRFGDWTDEEIIQVYEMLANLFRLHDKIGVDGKSRQPEEIAEDESLPEGAAHSVLVNSYERNPEARRKCLAIYGPICRVCKFDFGRKYGPVAEGFIHVHHLKPLSEIGGRYMVDPEKDLRPVCPNCHAVLHMRNPPFSIEEVAGFMEARRVGE